MEEIINLYFNFLFIYIIYMWNFRSHHNTYLRGDPDGRVNLTTITDIWERWTLEQENGYFYIKSHHGTYLRADPDNNINLTTNRMEWERWTLERDKDNLYIKSSHGTYLRADPNGTVNLTTNRLAWERWNPWPSSKDSITTIITTCCRKNAPDNSIILENIRQLIKYSPLLTKNIVIVFDGGEVLNNNLDGKCRDRCNINNYNIYINKTIEQITNLLPVSNLIFKIMPERSCLTASLKAGIQEASTEFINIMQEDLILKKSFDVSAVIKSIKENKRIDIIRYDHSRNQYHFDFNINHCSNKFDNFKKEILKINGLTLSKSNQYCDQCQITTKEFYNTHIFPNTDNYSFMEHTLICEVGDKLPETIWHLGNYEEGNYSDHVDGRNAK